jgi:hypothetical protein
MQRNRTEFDDYNTLLNKEGNVSHKSDMSRQTTGSLPEEDASGDEAPASSSWGAWMHKLLHRRTAAIAVEAPKKGVAKLEERSDSMTVRHACHTHPLHR